MIKGLIAMTMIEYAMTFLGTPYVWGGNTPDEGLDCSGFVCEVLRSNGVIGSKDYNSQMLYEKLMRLGKQSGTGENSVVFYGKSNLEITHVAFMINGYQVIEAAGEGRENTEKGFVRIRPFRYRSDLVASIKL